MTMLASAADRPVETIDGVRYLFRTPTAYDLPKMSWRLTRARVRRPTVGEYKAAALTGIAALAEQVGAPDEGAAQREIIERWYDELLPEIDEDTIDEPDLVRRAAIVAELQTERAVAMAAALPMILAIEANLDRHWSDWAELRADAKLWDQVSAIDAARLLLVSVDDETLPRVADGDDQGLVVESAWLAVPASHRAVLGTVALGLLAPTETQRKN